MALRVRKGLALVALLGVAAGCNERQEGTVRENARQVGKELGKATEEVKETGREAAEGLREGYGGSGQENGKGPLEEGDLQPGNNPGVINDGEGPLEEREGR